MPSEGSVAPRERVNIVYKPALGDAQEQVELPLKLLVVGDFTGRPDDRVLEDRKPTNIDKDSFNGVMKSQDLGVTIQVQNRLSGKEGEEMPVTLKFGTLKDFEPESVVNQTPELQKLLELRKTLTALKGPLGNMPEFRKRIQAIVNDPAARERLLKELGGGSTEAEKAK